MSRARRARRVGDGRGTAWSWWPGADQALPPGAATVPVVGPFDLSAVVLGDTGRVAGDDDFVSYNQPSARASDWSRGR